MALLTRAALAAVLLLAGSGCQRSPTFIDVAERSISVHAILVADSDGASVLVTRPGQVGNSGGPSGTLPVTNAVIRLVHAGDTIALSGTHACMRTTMGHLDSAGCYSAPVSGGIRAGATYELLVTIPGEEPIHGSTRVPAPPQILEPSTTAPPPVLRIQHPTLAATPLLARWSGGGSDVRTELRFVTDRSDCFASIGEPDRANGHDHIAVSKVDTLTVTPGSVQCAQAPAERYAARLLVTIYDENYSRYLQRLGESTQLRHNSAGITGAFGVFGAAASSAVPVVLSVQ